MGHNIVRLEFDRIAEMAVQDGKHFTLRKSTPDRPDVNVSGLGYRGLGYPSLIGRRIIARQMAEGNQLIIPVRPELSQA